MFVLVPYVWCSNEQCPQLWLHLDGWGPACGQVINAVLLGFDPTQSATFPNNDPSEKAVFACFISSWVSDLFATENRACARWFHGVDAHSENVAGACMWEPNVHLYCIFGFKNGRGNKLLFDPCSAHSWNEPTTSSALRHHYRARNWTFDENHFLVSS